MSDPQTNLSADLVDVVKGAYEFFEDFEPQTRSVRYNYREANSEMTFFIRVPDSRKRQFGKVKIPLADGYRLKGMFSLPDYKRVNASHTSREGYITFNPKELPNQNEFIVTLRGDVEPDTLNEIVHLKSPEDPTRTEEEDSYWIHSAIKRPGVMKEVYDDMQVDNVDISMNVGVQRCFSNSIPKDVLSIFDRTKELLEASNEHDRNKIVTASKRRYEARQNLSTSPAEAADIIRSLATAEHLQDFIDIEDPFRERNINPGTPKQNLFPETVSVDVTTDLHLDRQAANGDIVLQKKDFQEFVEGKIDDEILE